MPWSERVHKLEAARQLVEFSTFVHVGGGLGDLAHHFKTNAYFRILRSFKEAFPKIKFYVYLEGKNPDLTRQIFDRDPNIDEVITVKHKEQNEWHWPQVAHFVYDQCGVVPSEMARYFPDVDPAITVRRVINRICTLVRFPKIRAISMDDFFQQWKLGKDDFEWDLAEINTTIEDEAGADEYLNAAGVKTDRLVMLHAWTNDETRCIYPSGRWAALASELRSAGFDAAVFGGPADRQMFVDIPRSVRLVDLTTTDNLGTKIAVLKRCAGVVCIDSGLMSLAWLHAIPTVSLVSAAKAKEEYNNTVDGFHWAVAAQEPFAVRHTLAPDMPANWEAGTIVRKLLNAMPEKGHRKYKGWKDQCHVAW